MTTLHAALRDDERSRRYPGWRVVAVCFLMALFCWGFGFYGHSVFLAELQQRHGWPAGLIAGASTAYYLFSSVLVIFASAVIDRLGPRRFVLLGSACLGASVALLGIVEAIWQLFAVYFLMSFGWATMSVAAITTILGRWFDARRGLAISLAFNGASSGGIVVIPALVAAIAWLGFPIALLGAALVMAVVLWPAVVAWMDRPPPRLQPAVGVVAERGGGGIVLRTRREALRDLTFWSISAPFSLALAVQAGFIVHQIAFLEPAMGRTQAGVAVALLTTMAVVGRLSLGVVIDRLNQRLASALSFLSQAAVLVLMLATREPWALLALSAVFGFSVGNAITFPALIVQREFAAASFALVIGLSTAVTQFTYAFGPGLLGLLRDVSGSYTVPFLVCAGLEVAAAALVMIRPRLR